jgi:cobalt-factor III methyltransferase
LSGSLSPGSLSLVSVGPGAREHISEAAQKALANSDLIASYELYLTWVKDLIAGKTIVTTPLTQERERAQAAVDAARQGLKVSLVSSGDIGIYAMAALVFELMEQGDTFSVNVVPGITAANSCASILGSPLSHDFATLSLSDLLCPFEWIERRAKAIADADLACVLYNVQSERRRQGVYKILDILLSGKSPATLCGVVKNAYRPGQESYIATLGELTEKQFDMLTTIVIGNRFTRRKRDWIYTPRGYGSWGEEASGKTEASRTDSGTLYTEAPQVASDDKALADAIWVFSGTADGNETANQLKASGRNIVVSVAGDYGAQAGKSKLADIKIIAGRLGEEKRRALMRDSQCKAVVDATHPYAENISLQLARICQDLKIPYLRLQRQSALEGLTENTDVILARDAGDAAQKAMKLGKRIFLATGSKDLETFLTSPGAKDKQWFLRLLPDEELLARAIKLGIPRTNICAMQGPFSQDFNEALFRDWQIDCIVTKDSGAAGGAEAKLNAAQKLGIKVVVLKRPVPPTNKVYKNAEEIISSLSELGV